MRRDRENWNVLPPPISQEKMRVRLRLPFKDSQSSRFDSLTE